MSDVTYRPHRGVVFAPSQLNHEQLVASIEHTHTWRHKRNRGRLPLLSSTSSYYAELLPSGEVRLAQGWWMMGKEKGYANEIWQDYRTMCTLDANNVYTFHLEPKEITVSACRGLYDLTANRIRRVTIHGVMQAAVCTRRPRWAYTPLFRYTQGLRITRTGDVLDAVPFARPKLDREKAKQFRFLGKWLQDVKAMAVFDTRDTKECRAALPKDIAQHGWDGMMMRLVADKIVETPADTFDLFYLTLMAARNWYWRRTEHSIAEQLARPYGMLRERILQQAGVYTLPYEV
jgi:hypothetical protein